VFVLVRDFRAALIQSLESTKSGLQRDAHNRPETHAGSQLIALLQRHSVSLLRFESPNSNLRGLVLPRPEPRWTYQVKAQFICEAPDASIGANFIP
jgi:hypothetical protein